MLSQRYLDVYAGQIQPAVGYSTFAATTAATTILTIPVNRWWEGVLTLSCSCQEAGAGTVTPQALGVLSYSVGAGGLPQGNPTLLAVQALSGANVVGGTVGTGSAATLSIPFLAYAGTGGASFVQVTVTIAGTSGRVDASASGVLF